MSRALLAQQRHNRGCYVDKGCVTYVGGGGWVWVGTGGVGGIRSSGRSPLNGITVQMGLVCGGSPTRGGWRDEPIRRTGPDRSM